MGIPFFPISYSAPTDSLVAQFWISETAILGMPLIGVVSFADHLSASACKHRKPKIPVVDLKRCPHVLIARNFDVIDAVCSSTYGSSIRPRYTLSEENSEKFGALS